jgi:hypothetical protein
MTCNFQRVAMTINSYSFGSMNIDGKHYSSDLIIYPDGKINSSWWRKRGHNLCVKDLDRTVGVKPEIVVIGTGANGLMKIGKETIEYLEENGIQVYFNSTGEAVKNFNNLSSSNSVVGLFHLTC